MADGDEGRPPAAADLLDSLTRRIHELSAQLAGAHGELETARKRADVYETFDETIQGAVTAALHAAYDIRVRAEESASTLVADARSEYERVLAEIARLQRERSELQAAQAPATSSQGSGAAHDPRLAGLRARAADALAGLLDEFTAETASVAGPRPAVVTPPEEMPPSAAAPLREVPASPATPQRPTAIPTKGSDEERLDELEVVISQVPAFARLVEVELRLRELPNVRTVYVRDYRDGVLSLVVGLVAPTTARELGELVASIARPRLAVLGSSRATLELRLEGEASVA